MNIQTARFVASTDLFEGFESLQEGYNNADLDFSFGDSNRTLIEKERFLKAVEENNEDADEDMATAFRARIEGLPADVYVDVEN